MAQKIIKRTPINSGLGDTLYIGSEKINDNFTDLYDKKTDKGGYFGTTQDLKDELDAGIITSAITYQTFADLPTAPYPAEGTPAKVANDPTPANNGYYSVSGGVWVQDAGIFDIIVDNDDIEADVNSLLIADRNSNVGGKLGYKVIRSGFDWSTIDSSHADSILDIRDDFDLTGISVTLPSNVVLFFNGGVLKNFLSLVFDDTIIKAKEQNVLVSSGTYSGTLLNEYLIPEWFGAFGDSLTDDYKAFKDMLSVGNNIRLGNKTYKITNTAPLVLPNGCVIKGSGLSKLNFTDKTQRYFIGTSVNDVVIQDIIISCSDETTENFLGGGYIRFDTCYNVLIKNVTVLNNPWDIIKFLSCNDFTIKDCKLNYGKSSAVQIELCNNFKVINNNLSKNGLMSTDDSFADLPTTWTGTHVGRGVTVFNGCYNGEISGNICELNSEYGIRVFSDSTVDGSYDILIKDNYVYDSGHPAGTYGTIILASNKGIDILINNDDTLSSTERITLSDNTIIRENKNYGDSVSINAYNSFIKNNKVINKGAALNNLTAYFLFGAYNCVFDSNYSQGCLEHYQYGGANSTDNVHNNDVCIDSLKFISGNPIGTNILNNAYAKHNSTTAISGENAIETSAYWIINGAVFDGFWRAVVVSGTNFLAQNVKTLNTVDVAFRNFSANNSGVIVWQCSFESQNPNEKSNTVYDSVSSQSVNISINSSIPTSGYYKAGSIVFNSGFVIDANSMILLGWKRLTTGTTHVSGTDWETIYVSTVSPAV